MLISTYATPAKLDTHEVLLFNFKICNVFEKVGVDGTCPGEGLSGGTGGDEVAA